MLIYIFSIFLILHGLVHLLYFCQAQGFFELQPGLLWPENAWFFNRFFQNDLIRAIAGIFCLLSALLFISGGVALFLKLQWWFPLILTSSVFSSMLFLFFWDGNYERLNDKGAIGIVINIAVFFVLLFFNWPVAL